MTSSSSFDNLLPYFMHDSDLISSAKESGINSATVDILQSESEFSCRSKQLFGPLPATMLEVGELFCFALLCLTCLDRLSTTTYSIVVNLCMNSLTLFHILPLGISWAGYGMCIGRG